VLQRRFRSSDVVAQLGGDEFAMLLPAVEVRDARSAAEDLLSAIQTAPRSAAKRGPKQDAAT